MLPPSELAQLNISRAEQIYALTRTRLQVASQISTQGLSTLIFLNGGGAVALLALFGHSDVLTLHPTLMKCAFGLLMVGLVVSVLAMTASFFSQNAIWAREQAIAELIYNAVGLQVSVLENPPMTRMFKYARPSAIALFALGLSLFVAGLVCAFDAAEIKQPLGPPPAVARVSRPIVKVAPGTPVPKHQGRAASRVMPSGGHG